MEYHYEGFRGCHSVCDLDVVRGKFLTLVVCTERPDNPGTSVTNMAERLAMCVAEEQQISPDDMIWIERYPRRGLHEFSDGIKIDTDESCDLVSFVRNKSGGLHTPNWKRIEPADVIALRDRISRSNAATVPLMGDALDRLYVQFDNQPSLLAILGQVMREHYPVVLPVPELELRDGHPPSCFRHGVVSFLWSLPCYVVNMEVALSALNWLDGTWFSLDRRTGLSKSRDVQIGRDGDRDCSWIWDQLAMLWDEEAK